MCVLIQARVSFTETPQNAFRILSRVVGRSSEAKLASGPPGLDRQTENPSLIRMALNCPKSKCGKGIIDLDKKGPRLVSLALWLNNFNDLRQGGPRVPIVSFSPGGSSTYR
jgi:hypothetical protein